MCELLCVASLLQKELSSPASCQLARPEGPPPRSLAQLGQADKLQQSRRGLPGLTAEKLHPVATTGMPLSDGGSKGEGQRQLQRCC